MDYEVFASRDVVDEWRVEAIDEESEGEVYVTIFSGPRARERAEEYAEWKRGAERTRERDEALARLDRVRKLVQKWRDSEYLLGRTRHGYDSLDCADELEQELDRPTG